MKKLRLSYEPPQVIVNQVNKIYNTYEEELRRIARLEGITHLSTGVAIVRDGKILLVRRIKGDFLGGNYEIPGGGVDRGETIIDGACREVLEETGLKVSKIIGMFDGFDYSTDKKPKVRQFNFLTEAEPDDVTLDPKEHDKFIWAKSEDIDNLNMTENMKKCIHTAFDIVI